MLAIFKKKKNSGVFVKTKNGFEPLDDSIAQLSINDISSHLGYNPFHVHAYHGHFNKRENIQTVIFEVFTENIAFILVRNEYKTPTEKALCRFLKDFKYEEEYDSIFIRDYLLEGIENKSLSTNFFKKVLDLKIDDLNGETYAERLDVMLFFINGYLASFKLSNNLEEWARHLKYYNRDIIANYAKVAKKYWIDDYDMIFNEVNIQSEAYANTPSGYKNEFIHLHRGEFNTINFLMLMVCHYNQKITEYQFENYNYGRYKKIDNSTPEIKIYLLGEFIYFFDVDGSLLKVEQMKRKT